MPTTLAFVAGLAWPSSAAAASLPVYDAVTLGLTDPDHTRPNGTRASDGSHLTDSGFVAGLSEPYPAVFSEASAWLREPTTGATIRLGYLGPEHTRQNGEQQSGVRFLTEAGHAVGFSERYLGSSFGGISAWIYDARTATTTRLGFFDADHVRSDGFQHSSSIYVTGSDWVAGNSLRYAGASELGQSAWVYDIATGVTKRIGLLDPEHTSSTGVQLSFVGRPNVSGDVAGLSYRYAGPSQYGQSAYFYLGTTGATERIGFFDPLHTGPSALQISDVGPLTDSGYATGDSRRFAGATALGQSAWIYDASLATTTRIGLFDGEHTRVLGGGLQYQFSRAGAPTESGYVVGSSDRYIGNFSLGQSSWVYDANLGVTTRLGLFDDEHSGDARGGPRQVSDATAASESGFVSGTSVRFSGESAFGYSAWLYDPASAAITRIGFSDAEHTRSDGFQSSFALMPTEPGLVAGHSERAAGGNSAWLYDPSAGTTTRLGLTDARHTSSNGAQVSTVSLFTVDAGYFAGTSARYGASGALGSTAWVYDANADTQYSIVLSERSDGYALSSVSVLTEAGFAFGSYELFDSTDASLGLRPFAWSADDGAVDLGALVDGGLAAAGWSFFESVEQVNGLAQVLGQGRLADGSKLAFLLVSVPEPDVAALLLAAILAVLASRRERDRHTG